MNFLQSARALLAAATTPPSQKSVIEWDLYEARRKLLQAQSLVEHNQAELAKANAEVDKHVQRVARLNAQLALVNEGRDFLEQAEVKRPPRITRVS